MKKNIIRVIRRAPDIIDFAIEMAEHYLRIYGLGKLQKMGFLDFEEMVIHAVWVDYLGDFFEFYDEDEEIYNTTINREDKNQLIGWMKNTLRADLVKFYKEKIIESKK